MPRDRYKRKPLLNQQFPPSEPCSCEVCLAYCQRPGWWTVAEARQAIQKGYAGRMMLEVAPEGGWAVLSPAFRGCELFGTGLQRLECRFCHHDRLGQGQDCHAALEADWHTPEGQALVDEWKA